LQISFSAMVSIAPPLILAISANCSGAHALNERFTSRKARVHCTQQARLRMPRRTGAIWLTLSMWKPLSQNLVQRRSAGAGWRNESGRPEEAGADRISAAIGFRVTSTRQNVMLHTKTDR